MKRTGSIASRVPPAVTTTCRPPRSASRAGPASGGRAAGSAARTGRSPTAADDRVHDRLELGQPPDPGLARRQRTAVGLDDGVAERRAGGRRWRPSPDASTCRRPWPGATTTGAEVARQVAVTTSPDSPAAIVPSQWAVAGATTMRIGACRRGRCGRSARRAGGRARRSRPGGATARRTTAARRTAPPTASASPTTSAPSARSSRSSSTAL